MWKQLVSSALELVGTWEDFVLQIFLQEIFKNIRGQAEKEPRISIPVPAVPVSELLAGKNRKICKSLN